MDAADIKLLSEVDFRSKNNAVRLDGLEQNYQALNDLTLSVRTIATDMKHIVGKVDNLTEEVTDIKKLPTARYNMIVDKIITGAVGAIVGALCAYFVK